MPKLILRKKSVLSIYFSFVLALILSSIPWEYFRAKGFTDRNVYVQYIDLYSNKIEWFDFSGLITKISYEWGWHYFLYYLESQLGFGSNIILFLISLFALTVSFLLISSRKSYYYCFFLLNPLYVDFFYSQVRLCFAIAFIYLSIMAFNRNKFLSALLLFPSLFIHTSSFLFAFIFYFAIFLEKTSFISLRNKFLISLFIGVVSALATGPYMSIILGSIEDRRVVYGDFSSPTLYMIYWLGLFLFFIIKYMYNKLGNLNYYYYYITITVLAMVFLNVFLSGYSVRFVVATLPFLTLTLSELKGKGEIFVRLLYIPYTVILWFFWLT